MAAVKYRLAGGEPSRKIKYQAGAGLPTGAGLTLVLTYVIGRLDPAMPPEILAVAAGLLASALTGGVMLLVGWATRPAKQDRPEIDPATLPKRPVEPLPGIPPED